MKSWIKYCQAALNRRFLIALAAVAMVLSLTAYEFDNARPGGGTSRCRRGSRR